MLKYCIIIMLASLFWGCSSDRIKKEYYADGKLKSETFYKSGKSNGYYISYYENSQIKDSGSIKEDQLDGLCKSYYENGKLNWLGLYKAGKINGFYKKYYENGNLRVDGFFKDARPDSIAKEYNENGQLELKTLWRQGIIMSVYCYYPNGNIKRRINYKNGIADSHINFDMDGVLLLPSYEFIFPKPKNDTIMLGEAFSADIMFLAHDVNSLTYRHVFIGKLDDNDSLIGEAKELPIKNKMAALYTDTPKEPGKHKFTGFLQYTKPNGRVVRAPFRWSYYVKEKSK